MTKNASILVMMMAAMMIGCSGSVGASASASASTEEGASAGGELSMSGADEETEGESGAEGEAEDEAVAEAAPAEAAPEDPDDVHLEGDHVTIDGVINFATNSDEILADSNELLDHIAQFLKNHKGDVKHLKVIGHTDTAGGASHNQKLSERRAASVVKALVDRGVSTELEHTGKGLSDPLCKEDTAECHAKNRRVEFLVIAD